MDDDKKFSPDTSAQVRFSDGSGLSIVEAARRRAQYGPNALPAPYRPGVFAMVGDELRNPLLLVLAAAAGAAMVFGERIDGTFILITLGITLAFGVGMRARAERALAALRHLLQPTAIVIRDGREQEVPLTDVVPGDRIVLRRGARVPADAGVVAVQALAVDESLLTGESLPVQKATHPTGSVDAVGAVPPTNGVWMVFQGTLVTEGSGVAVVTATGAQTELARIAASVARGREATPLEAQLARFARVLAVAIAAIAVALLVLGVARGERVGAMLATTIALAVAAVPEGLAVALTIILAVGAVRLARRRCLVRRMIATETLGAVSVILTDKTGTLTEGHMEPVAVLTASGRADIPARGTATDGVRALLEAAAVGTEVIIANPDASPAQWTFVGSATEAALVRAAGALGVPVGVVRAAITVLDRMPFASEQKYSATLIACADGTRDLILLGALERIVAPERVPPSIAQEVDARSREGFRVVAASRMTAFAGDRIGDAGGWVARAEFLGAFLLRDPLRPDATDALREAYAAGIRTVMVTGDHPSTAARIAADLGLRTDGAPRVMTGAELAALDDAALDARIADVDVVARASYAHKVRLVAAWQRRGATVAVTGDGVNDAPALAAADVGVAMGSGTDVAREAADIVLLDDHYATIVAGVAGGRTAWDNIRKTVRYLLVSSATEVLLVAMSVVSGMPILILPAQILWVNLLEDTLPAAALAFEPAERGVMREPPRPRRTPIVDREARWLVLGAGLAKDALLLATGIAIFRATGDLDLTRTIVFGALAMDSIFFVFAIRTLRVPIWRSRPWENPWLLAAVAGALTLLIVGLTLPALRPLLHTAPLPVWGWGAIIVLSAVGLLAVEAVKAMFRVQRRRRIIV